MGKAIYFSIFILCVTAALYIYNDHMQKTINFERQLAIAREEQKVVERKVYEVPEKSNHKISVYRIDKETLMIILDEKELKSKRK